MASKSDQLIESNGGIFGCDIVAASTAAVGGPWVTLYFVTAGTLTAFTATGTTGTFTGVTFPNNSYLQAPITAFTTGVGTIVVAYKGVVL